MVQTRDIQIALETFRQHGGVMKTNQALMQGIHPAALYRLVEDGQIGFIDSPRLKSSAIRTSQWWRTKRRTRLCA